MVDRAQPGAIDSLIRGDELRQVFGRFSEGFIVPGTDPTPAAQRRGDIDETALDAFSLSTSTSSLDVTVAPGEAFVGGWFCRDRPTTLTLPANTTVDIVVGFNDQAVFDPNTDADRDDADEVIVALAQNTSGDLPTTVAHRVSTDGSGVTSNERVATVGSSVSVNTLEATGSITDAEGNTFTDLSDPVRVTEEASTFAESDVSITTNNTSVVDGSVEIDGSVDGSSDSATLDSDLADSVESKWGLIVNANTDLKGFRVSIQSVSRAPTSAYLTDTNLNILDSDTSVGAGGTTTLLSDLTSGTDYYVLADDDGNTWDVDHDSSKSFPISTSDFDIPTGYNGNLSGGDDFYGAITNITAQKKVLSGNALVTFDSGVPADIDSWDLATFQRTLDGETVTVDTEDGNGNVLFSDIGPNFDISTVDTSKNVKLRANFSRSDTSNNPTLDYAARRFTR